MVTVEFERGLFTLLIPDAKGVTRRYSLEVQASDVWLATLTRLDTEAAHTVVFDRDAWNCSCDDFRYRRGSRETGCKHIRHLKQIREFAACVLVGGVPCPPVLTENF